MATYILQYRRHSRHHLQYFYWHFPYAQINVATFLLQLFIIITTKRMSTKRDEGMGVFDWLVFGRAPTLLYVLLLKVGEIYAGR